MTHTAYLKGRAALVTGGSGAIGKAIAERLADLGAQVVLGYNMGEERAASAVEAIRARGGTAWAVRSDLSSDSGCLSLVEHARAHLGRINILVNAAGVSFLEGAFRTGIDDWRRVLDVNATAAFLCTREVLSDMIEASWGRIVNVGSIWGEVGAAWEVAYSASKAALTGMTKALAKEVARSHVTVNVVAPGVIDTPMNDGFDPEERKALQRRIPVGRFGRPEDVAAAVAFLCSEDARYVTGHTLWVTGGFDPIP